MRRTSLLLLALSLVPWTICPRGGLLCLCAEAEAGPAGRPCCRAVRTCCDFERNQSRGPAAQAEDTCGGCVRIAPAGERTTRAETQPDATTATVIGDLPAPMAAMPRSALRRTVTSALPPDPPGPGPRSVRLTI